MMDVISEPLLLFSAVLFAICRAKNRWIEME